MRPSVKPHSPRLKLTALALAGLLGACASHRSPDDPLATLSALPQRTVVIDTSKGMASTEAQAIEAYRQFVAGAPQAPQSADALRRMGDLAMELAEQASAGTTASAATAEPSEPSEPNYGAAIAAYQAQLAGHPQDPHRARVLYQLARAQEQKGDLEAALQTLTQLVQEHPRSAFSDEAQFRRGELLFTSGLYGAASQAYTAVLRTGPGNPYHDRALYMQGWSQFKLGHLDEALKAFMGVLDLKLPTHDSHTQLDMAEGLSRADRELLEDTFRVTSLSLANLQGAESIAPLLDSPLRRRYAFRVYEQLGELYLKQDRPKDAADAFVMFANLNPLDVQAAALQARQIDTLTQAGFATLALQAKKDHVARYGQDSALREAKPQAWAAAQVSVKTYLTELARHHHALAQASKQPADVDEAVHWYRSFLAAYPSDPQAPEHHFMLAELLFDAGRFALASEAYEHTAYAYPANPVHPRAADAGYAALLAYPRQHKQADAAALPALKQAGVASALRFAQAFPTDARTGPVLADAADQLYAMQDGEQAARVARQVIDLMPPAAEAQRRVAWTVLAHTAFERGAFDAAEQAYGEVLQLTAAKAPGRNELFERQVAAVYKQGEQARDAGQLAAAVGHFSRIATVAPLSPVRATAQYDAAAALIALQDWPAAVRTLTDFRQRFPQHPLQPEVGPKLVAAHLAQDQWASAAAELERLSAASKDPALARDALWQAAELHEKAGARAAATKAYERHLAQSLAMRPQPLVPAIEARARLAGIARADGNAKREAALTQEIFNADRNGGAARTERTRYLGAQAALALAAPVAEAYRKVALVEPLQKQLKLKKAKMADTLQAYAVAAEYGVADVSTAATFHIASIYRDFGRALMNSERPKKMSQLEREQYDVLLEEQAFPFEEKATALHEVNARRAAEGLYDPWVQRSFEALRELLPVRYGKLERSEGVIDAIR